MSKMAELDWDIEYRATELGMGAVDIAKELECPLAIVNDWFKENGIWDKDVEFDPPELEVYEMDEVYSPYNGA